MNFRDYNNFLPSFQVQLKAGATQVRLQLRSHVAGSRLIGWVFGNKECEVWARDIQLKGNSHYMWPSFTCVCSWFIVKLKTHHGSWKCETLSWRLVNLQLLFDCFSQTSPLNVCLSWPVFFSWLPVCDHASESCPLIGWCPAVSDCCPQTCFLSFRGFNQTKLTLSSANQKFSFSTWEMFIR